MSEVQLSGGGELGEVPYLRPHPGAAAVFARRAARFAALAPGHAAGDYLALLARVAAAQQAVAGRLVVPEQPAPTPGALPAPSPGELALDAGRPPPPAWREALRLLLGELSGVELPQQGRAALERLQRLGEADLDGLAERLLAGRPSTLDLPVSLFAGAALQVVYTVLAGRLAPTSIARVEDGCPVCGASPTVGVVLGDDKLRYLACGLCATSWHHTRAQCVLCRSAEKVGYLSVEGDAGPARAETCGGCQAWLKLLYMERAPSLEPLADDVASMALDLLVAEHGGGQRLGQNPYLVTGPHGAEA